MKAFLARKVGMTRIFSENGAAYAVTLLDASPNVVVQVKTKDKEGYDAVQVGFGSRRAKNDIQADTRPFEKGRSSAVRQAGRDSG